LRAKEKVITAKCMKLKNIPIAVIAEVTGLSIEEIERL
jgi:hypothetical protein